MSEGKKRRVHTAEFKAKVGLEAIRGVKTMTEIAQEYSVHPVLAGQWKKEILEHAGTLFGTQRGPKPVDASCPENKLYGTIGRLKMEVDWLKKVGGMSQEARQVAAVAAMRSGGLPRLLLSFARSRFRTQSVS